jgi:hypothetical protein
MSEVSVQIVRWVDDNPQPGVVEARLRDVSGREWVFVDKWPIFAEEDLEAESNYPRPGVMRCEVVASGRDDRRREVHTIDTSRPDGVEAEGGESRFDVLAEQIIYG